MHYIILAGFIANMLGLQVSVSGVQYLKFDLAVRNSASQSNTTFFKCVAFGKTAELIQKYFVKGSPMGVYAEARNNNYTDANGVKHYSYEFVVRSVSFVAPKSANPAVNMANSTAKVSSVQSVTPSATLPFPPAPGVGVSPVPVEDTPQFSSAPLVNAPLPSVQGNGSGQGINLGNLSDVFSSDELTLSSGASSYGG